MKTLVSSQTSIDFSIVSEVTLVYRNHIKPADRPMISGSSDVYKIFRDTWDHTLEHCESFRLLLLNRANKVLGITTLSTGSLSGTLVDVRIVMQYALKANAHAIIVSHNHPSGNHTPSEQDHSITQKLKEAGKILDIALLDHIILTPDENHYYSFADEGLL
jgi:DNA repair protein RadC